jgi:glutathione S-transferase
MALAACGGIAGGDARATETQNAVRNLVHPIAPPAVLPIPPAEPSCYILPQPSARLEIAGGSLALAIRRKPVLKLYGFAVSNYFNMVKLALLEKGIPFETIVTMPSQNSEYLAISPRGKVPCLCTGRGFINETDAILDYLEESQTGPALLPSDPFDRAQVRALVKEIELYLELPARLCFTEAFFGTKLPDAIKAKAKQELLLGIDTLRRHGKFAPYVAGDSFTLADIYFLYTIENVVRVAKTLFDIDLLGDFPAATALLERLKQMPNAVSIEADRAEAMGPFLAAMRAG